MLVAGCQENESCSKVLYFLERLDDRIGCTHEETTAVVEPSEDIGSNESLLHTYVRILSKQNRTSYTGLLQQTGFGYCTQNA